MSRSAAFYILSGMMVFFCEYSSARYYDLYRADYTKGSYCSAIGGACASDIDFDNSFFQNPASLTAGGADFDYDYDYIEGNNLEPGMKGANSVSETSFMFAIAYSKRNWGIGLSVSEQRDEVDATTSLIDDQGATQLLRTISTANTWVINIPLSYRITRQFHFGAALVTMFQHQEVKPEGTDTFSSTAAAQSGPSFGASLGSIYEFSPFSRFGIWARTPITYYLTQDISTAAFGSKIDYHEDIGLNLPLLCAAGYSFNPWEDKAVFMFDLNYVGVTRDGNLLSFDTFSSETSQAGNRKVIAKGRKPVVEPRMGLRTPWWHGSNGTLMLGSYYENSRWENYRGRPHLTGGLAYKLPFHVPLLDEVELMAGFDVAKDYQQIFLTYR